MLRGLGYWFFYGQDSVGPWTEAVKRSLITLQALTDTETGGIIAAPTTSLPEVPGGDKNWDYRYTWLRDSTFALSAFLNAGYHGEARIHYIVQSKRSGNAAEPLLERDGRCEPLHINLTVEMKVRKLALDRPHHGAAWDTKVTGAKVGPFLAVRRGVAIAPATCGKNAADKVGLVQKQIVVCNHDRPLHPWGKIAGVDPQPDIEMASRLSHADVWFCNDGAVEISVR